jgi:hypothetical protein
MKLGVQREAVDFQVKEYFGRRTAGLHSSLRPGELRDLVNWDILRNEGQDEFQSRRGSRFLRPSSSPAKWGSTEASRTVTWDVGSEEYELVQVGNTIQYQALLAPGNPGTVANFAGGAFTLGSTAAADLFLHGNRLFIVHPAGNKVVEWNGTAFRGRTMGMTHAHIRYFGSDVGNLQGRYVYAVEKVYRVNGADVLVSSPNRRIYDTRELAETGFDNVPRAVQLTLRNEDLDGDTLWTHVRLWRSKRLDVDTSDLDNIVEAQGLPDELYEVALITRAELEAASLTAIATGSSLPEGNAYVMAGLPSGNYTLQDQAPDTFLFNFIGLDRIELEPLPAATVGCFHAGRVWISGAGGSNDILYSNNQGTKYAELYDPENIIETGQDGQAVVRLFGFERDLVALKEGKSGRLVAGDPEQEFEVFDPRIGVAAYTLAEYIPGIGILAITNDTPALKLLGLDYRWTSELYGLDIATPIQDEISALTAAHVRFKYGNGKIFLSAGNGVFHVLHVLHRRGWGRYLLPLATGHVLNLFTFAAGTRLGVLGASAYTVELEVANLTTDDSMEDDTTGNAIDLAHTTHMFQSDDGRHLLEKEWFSIVAQLSAPLVAIPFNAGLPWPLRTDELETEFVISPYNYPDPQQREREYRLFLQPKGIGRFKWNRLSGHYLHFRIETQAPAIIRSQTLRALVDRHPSAFQAADPYQVLINAPGVPRWADETLLDLHFDEPTGDIAQDASGNNRHHTWAAGSPAGSHAFDAALVPSGGQAVVGGTGSGYAPEDWTAMDYIGDGEGGLNSEDLTYEYIASFPSLAAPQVIQEGGDGADYWRLQVNEDGALEYQLSTLAYKFTSPAGVIAAGSTQYTIQFVLSNGGMNGQFYAAARTANFATLITNRSDL